MAVDSNALNLAQYALMSNDPLVTQITWSLLDQDSVLNDIPLLNKKTLVANGIRFQGDALPTPDWTPLNVDPVVVTAVPTPYQEQAFLLRNAIDTDKKLVQDENQIQDPRAVRLEAYLKSVRLDFSDKFINNNHITGDKDCFTGLKYRLDNPTVYGCESELKINTSGVDMTQGAGTATTANNFIEFVDTLLDYLGATSGDGVVLYMNEVMKRRFARAIRIMGATGGFTTIRDAFNRPVDMYKGAVIRVVGRKKDQTTQIITSTEDSAGAAASSTYTSIYGVRFGTNDGLFGWQFDPLSQSVNDLGLLDNGITYRTVIDYAVGLMASSTRAIGRLYGIKLA